MNIAVYCGSTLGKNPNFVTKTKELGKWMKENNHTLIYGGGDAGLMGIIAKEMMGNEIIGVLPKDIEFICSRPHTYCTRVIVADSMSERKKIMEEQADVYIALPGGIGTLDELSEVITLSKIGASSKKVICFDIDHFYQPFQEYLKGMIENEFLEEKDLDLVLFSDSIEEIEHFII